MKRFLTLLAFQLPFVALHAQAHIKFDTTLYDCGRIPEDAGTYQKELRFINTGNEPLVITNAVTGDGGSMATYPKEPILPGKKGVILFYYDTKRIGPFDRTVTITSNASAMTILRVKGEVTWRITTVVAEQAMQNIGSLNFGDVDTVCFLLTNTGKEDLHIYFPRYRYPECDLLRYQLEAEDPAEEGPENNYYNAVSYKPGARIRFTLLIKNVYGNTGAFEHRLQLIYNSHDTLVLTIKGRYTGVPGKKVLYEGNSTFLYENDRLARRQEFTEDGKLLREDFFEAGHCTRSLRYHWYTHAVSDEFIYRNGMLTEEKKYKAD